jgi:hypothetical protein
VPEPKNKKQVPWALVPVRNLDIVAVIQRKKGAHVDKRKKRESKYPKSKVEDQGE